VSRDEQQLRDEIALRESSLADAQREYRAGELSQSALEAIEQRERDAIERATRTLQELASAQPATTALARVRRTRYLVVGLTCLAVALGVLLWSALSPRQAGNSITGSIALSNAQKVQQYLSEAEADVANGNDVTALSAYQEVLTLDPKNVAALTQVGWLDFSAGSSDQNLTIMNVGVSDLRKAITLAPKQAAPRLYYAIVADSTPGNQALAKAQFKVFLALKPSAGQLAIAKPFLKKLGLATS
jgi:cytochrome c-type biogenesis protein CcmH/NrfG